MANAHSLQGYLPRLLSKWKRTRVISLLDPWYWNMSLKFAGGAVAYCVGAICGKWLVLLDRCKWYLPASPHFSKHSKINVMIRNSLGHMAPAVPDGLTSHLLTTARLQPDGTALGAESVRQRQRLWVKRIRFGMNLLWKATETGWAKICQKHIAKSRWIWKQSC